MGLKHDVARGILQRFPKAATRTLAGMLQKENPTLYKNYEDARGALRYVRGVKGKQCRDDATDKSAFVTPRDGRGDPFGKIPEGLTHFDRWKAVQFTGPMRVLVLPDIHIPYHRRDSLVMALKWGQDANADTVLLNGDTLDAFACSFWEKDPRKRDFASEVKAVREFLGVLRETFPKARIIFKEGNHEERYIRYMMCKAPELLGIAEFSLPEVLHCSQYGITDYIGEKRPIRLGQLNVIHGHEYPFAISNPVNPARGFFLRTKTLCMGSHFHQTSQHSEKDLEEKVVSTWSTGCLADLHPDYRPLNNWNAGFAFVEVDSAGAFLVQNLRIIDGRVY